MALVCDTISVKDRLTIDISDEREVINVKDEKFEFRTDSLRERLFVNDRYAIYPSYSYRSMDYVIPESLLQDMYVDIYEVRDSLLDFFNGKAVGYINDLYYSITSEDGVITQRLLDLESKYLGTEDGEKYVIETELTNLALAKEYYMDAWNGTYIQDREDWNVEWEHTDGEMYTNETYLEARWNVQAETKASPDIEEIEILTMFAKDVANRDFPLTALQGELIYDNDGGKVYRYKTDILAQHIYDLALRVDNNYATYTNEITAFVNNQSAYVQQLTILKAGVDELVSRDAVSYGDYIKWDGVESTLAVGMWKMIGENKYVYHGGAWGTLPDHPGWVPVGNSVYGTIGSSSKLLTNTETGAIVGWEFIDSPEISNEFVIHAESFKIENSTIDGYQPFTISGGIVKFNGIVEFSNINNMQYPKQIFYGQNVANGLYCNFNNTNINIENGEFFYYDESVTQVLIREGGVTKEGKGCLRITALPYTAQGKTRSSNHVVLAKTNTNYNINIEKNSIWIISADIYLSSYHDPYTDSGNIFIGAVSVNGTGKEEYFHITAEELDQWHRVHFTVDFSTDDSTKIILVLGNASSNDISNTHAFFDNIMVEKQAPGQTEPSPYSKPIIDENSVAAAINNNTTTIDGGHVTLVQLNASQIETFGLSAESIKAGTLDAMTITSASLYSSRIESSTIVFAGAQWESTYGIGYTGNTSWSNSGSTNYGYGQIGTIYANIGTIVGPGYNSGHRNYRVLSFDSTLLLMASSGSYIYTGNATLKFQYTTNDLTWHDLGPSQHAGDDSYGSLSLSYSVPLSSYLSPTGYIRFRSAIVHIGNQGGGTLTGSMLLSN